MQHLTEAQLKEAATELGMEYEEVKIMYERAIAPETSKLYKSLKSGGKLNALASALKASKGVEKGVAKSNGTSGAMPDTTATDDEEIPDVVKQAAKLLKMDAAKLYGMVKVRTKAVGIQGGVPNGSETRAKRKLRMVTPLKDAVRGKLLKITNPNEVATTVKSWPAEEQVEALQLFKDPAFLAEYTGISLKELQPEQQVLRPFTSTHLNANTVTGTRTKQVAEARQQVANTRRAALHDMYTSAVNLPDDDVIQERMKAIEDGQPLGGNDVYNAFTSTHLNKKRVLTRRKEVIAPTMAQHQAVNASLQLKQDEGVARFHAQQDALQHLRGTKLGR